jgi:hypothetical protein
MLLPADNRVLVKKAAKVKPGGTVSNKKSRNEYSPGSTGAFL